MKYLADNFDVAELASDKCLGEVVEHRGEVRLVFYHLREVFHSQRKSQEVPHQKSGSEI